MLGKLKYYPMNDRSQTLFNIHGNQARVKARCDPGKEFLKAGLITLSLIYRLYDGRAATTHTP
jgi:hypothetical protein